MLIKKVYLNGDVYNVCTAHVLTNEKEEVMGLLIGEITHDNYCYISAQLMLRRSDKKADRVEISPEQLSNASLYAENISKELNKPLRIVGWYHSHPHITVWPSQIDLRTQTTYQFMDEGFIGIIISVFNKDKLNVNRIQTSCFQSKNLGANQFEQVEIDIEIKPIINWSISTINSYISLCENLIVEENELYNKSKNSNVKFTSALYNNLVYPKNLVQIIEYLQGPLLSMMEDRTKTAERLIQNIQKQKEHIMNIMIKDI